MIWLVFDLLFPGNSGRSAGAARPNAGFSRVLVGLVYLMILSGGLVAGTRAGFAYSTWPLMGDSFIPRGLYAGTPAWLDMFEDITTVQFNHRIFAYLLTVLIGVFVTRVYRSGEGGRGKLAVTLLLAALGVQLVLGISTLLLHVPLVLAAAHQGGAMLLLTATLYTSHVLVKQ